MNNPEADFIETRATIPVGRLPAPPIFQTRSLENDESRPDAWLLWQLADSAFPTGGFAHSSGLEAAWQQGAVANGADIASFAEASVQQLSHSALPFVHDTHRDPERLAELDRLCDAFTTNHVANRASRLQGRAFLVAAARIFAVAPLPPPFGHFAPVFGAVTQSLNLSREAAANLFCFNHLRGLLAAAVRLGVVGPMEAQALQHRLAPQVQALLADCVHLTVDDLSQTAPLLEIWQGAQDRLYSRLFQS